MELQRLSGMLGTINGTDGMWLILRDIYRSAGWTHAVATLKGWGWKP
jgi:hypothetical protein